MFFAQRAELFCIVTEMMLKEHERPEIS